MNNIDILYSKSLVFFVIIFLPVFIFGCNSGIPPIEENLGSLEIDSTPSGAEIYLDGENTGQVTPWIFPNMDIGEHTILLSKFHYQNWEVMATVVSDQTTYFNAILIWAPEERIIIQPNSLEGEDAHVINFYADQNFGHLSDVGIGVCDVIGSSTNDIWRGYPQFDLDSVPPEAVILDAGLGLCYMDSTFSSSPPIGLYKITESWQEDTITWNNQPSALSMAVDIQYIPENLSYMNDFVYWQITDLVVDWHENLVNNHGMLLKHANESSLIDETSSVWFVSSDYMQEYDLFPKLIVDFYIP